MPWKFKKFCPQIQDLKKKKCVIEGILYSLNSTQNNYCVKWNARVDIKIWKRDSWEVNEKVEFIFK